MSLISRKTGDVIYLPANERKRVHDRWVYRLGAALIVDAIEAACAYPYERMSKVEIFTSALWLLSEDRSAMSFRSWCEELGFTWHDCREAVRKLLLEHARTYTVTRLAEFSASKLDQKTILELLAREFNFRSPSEPRHTIKPQRCPTCGKNSKVKHSLAPVGTWPEDLLFPLQYREEALFCSYACYVQALADLGIAEPQRCHQRAPFHSTDLSHRIYGIMRVMYGEEQ
jgi:predicted Zn-ribbon and HTH transcriptional regulator